MKIEKQGVKIEPVEELKEIKLMNEKIIKINSEIPEQVKEKLEQVLQNYSCIFAMQASEIVGIDPTIIAHSLNINPSIKHVKQKK